MAPLSNEDLDHLRALWEEWTAGLDYDLDVQIIGEHSSGMDPDRPVGALLTAKLSVRLKIWSVQTPRPVLIFDESCPYDGEALKRSVRALARRLAEVNGSPGGEE